MQPSILILHNDVADDAAADDLDVLVQADVVEAALRKQEYSVRRLACTLDLQSLRERLGRERPTVVFNLVESLGGTDFFAFAAAAMLEHLNIPFTGASSQASFRTNDKIAAKAAMQTSPHRLCTPAWLDRNGRGSASQAEAKKFIVKAIYEHASLGMDDLAIVSGSPADVVAAVRARTERLGRPCFAEEFISGREFNISLLADGAGNVQVLPPAEIDFSQLPAGKPHIVGYAAKWHEHSPEFSLTPRTFDFPPEDRPLLDELTRAAKACWELFDCRGYARVDFRVDERQVPWVLEINTNPCLSPDAGFAAALERAGISFDVAIARILADAFPRNGPL